MRLLPVFCIKLPYAVHESNECCIFRRCSTESSLDDILELGDFQGMGLLGLVKHSYLAEGHYQLQAVVISSMVRVIWSEISDL